MHDAHANTEQALVRAGWELVDLLGRLGAGQSQRMLATRWEAERTRAALSLQPLKTGSAVSEGIRNMYEGPSNWTRFRRTLDFVRAGDRLLEIGLGRGYLAGMFCRDGQVSAYRGIDLVEDNVRATRELLELNDLADHAEVAQGDLYDLTRAHVEAFGADLVVCCEVIEHVSDPELAVKTLADALPEGADLLLSVPVLGRLEGVWGHVALFDAPRIQKMVADSGLTIHAVDVVDNTWVFVLASHEAGPSARASRAASAPADVIAEAPVDPELPRAMRRIDLTAREIGPSRWTKRLARSSVRQEGEGLLCEFTGADPDKTSGGQYGGVTIPVLSPRGIRLELGLDDIETVQTFYVDAYAGSKRVGRWKWEPGMRRPKSNPATFVMRPGTHGLNFKPVEIGDLKSADAFDIFVQLEPGSTARFRITRAALLA